MALIARVNILYENTEYKPGDELPADTPARMADAWIGCRSAEYISEEPAEEPSAKPAKARAVTAPAGRSGLAVPSSGPGVDLVGRIPPPELRGAVKEPAKRRGRKSPK